ncbi:MAG: glycosyltransferase, partial [Actinobacteria bacterium]|nr:glycosyltransferase [Actinomycetota bacterium]
MDAVRSRCDLHVHSRYSTDSGNYALRRARLPESFTDPERVYRVARARGMDLVTISDHNTLEGALRIAHLENTFLSVEVTTHFPEDDTPLHVLVWNLTEDDHRELQPYRPSVYELASFLRDRGLVHALAHPLYRMGAHLTTWHVERLMLLFSLWEGRNGARPERANVLACRLAALATPTFLERLADRHGIAPRHDRICAVTAGSDDHGALDIATTWTEAEGATVDEYLGSLARGEALPLGAHGSAVKLAHAMAALAANAWRDSGAASSPLVQAQLRALFDDDAVDAQERHAEIEGATRQLVRLLGERARSGGVGLERLPALGPRLAALAFAGALELPYLAASRHLAGSRTDIRTIERSFFTTRKETCEPRALVFTDTYAEANGVAGTMRRLAAEGAAGRLPLAVATAREEAAAEPGLIVFPPDWSMPLPSYEQIELHFPLVTDVLARVEAEAPDVVHVATPGPVGATALFAGKMLGVPVVGSYHTELGPYALRLTRDPVVAEATAFYVDWFYRQCDLVLAPTVAVAASLAARGVGRAIGVWGRGVDMDVFNPGRRDESVAARLRGDGSLVFLSVGRVSDEKRIDTLLAAFELVRQERPDARLVVVGDGPARRRLAGDGPAGVQFLGEVRGLELAAIYASADVFCFPSTTDTFGQVLLEAAASGLPAIGVAAGGTAELVAHGESGLVVPADDPPAMAAAMLRLAGDDGLRLRFGARAVELARERSWERSYAELRHAYGAVTTQQSVEARPLLA